MDVNGCLSCLFSYCLVLSCLISSRLVLSLFVSLVEETSNTFNSSHLYQLARGRFEVNSRRQTGAWISLSRSVRCIDYMSGSDIIFLFWQVADIFIFPQVKLRPQWA
jgi:hypothetical protein